MAKRRDRLRWWIAYQLGRLPGQCWADLVFWVFRDNGRTLPWSPMSPGCKLDLAEQGACYCGKLRRPGTPARPQGHATDVTWQGTDPWREVPRG